MFKSQLGMSRFAVGSLFAGACSVVQFDDKEELLWLGGEDVRVLCGWVVSRVCVGVCESHELVCVCVCVCVCMCVCVCVLVMVYFYTPIVEHNRVGYHHFCWMATSTRQLWPNRLGW